MRKIKSIIKNLLPESALLYYHKVLAHIACLIYKTPSKKLIIIGVTGTKGKTTTANFIHAALNASNIKTGILTTANIRIGNDEILNKFHMTMPGRFAIQKILSDMVRAGCTHCVVETTSEGIKQHRAACIHYDIGVFTNLTPEHLPSHDGSFEKYKQEKGKMFAQITKWGHKIIDNKQIEQLIITNADSEYGEYFASFDADKKISYSIKNKSNTQAFDITDTPLGVQFGLDAHMYSLSILGSFNVYNALPAIILAQHFGGTYEQINNGFKKLSLIPGRMERIEEGQDFTTLVDYAHEEQSITAILNTARNVSTGKVIILLGAEGGGRDTRKRAIMGRLAAQKADYCIISNVDPYDDNPALITEDIARSAEEYGMARNENLFVIEDREQGIKKAIALAQTGDIVLITGKGAEQSITINGIAHPWDDRTTVKNAIKEKVTFVM